ncbi:hypothetical protein LY78DRAFT_420066 [Colletotrichum sublineola]|nr:hypothetical protein LY78DRAFT_420066 [Colletotrichum sublineola]
MVRYVSTDTGIRRKNAILDMVIYLVVALASPLLMTIGIVEKAPLTSLIITLRGLYDSRIMRSCLTKAHAKARFPGPWSGKAAVNSCGKLGKLGLEGLS